ncbi:TauD-domain-containing protein [Xylariaceae sp. FL0255]|nr:TauD-domain-containing protein [Xylariaceae sp. FL0255]
MGPMSPTDSEASLFGTPWTRATKEDGSAMYPDYLPFYDPHKKPPNLLKKTTKVIDLSPHIGTEVEGVELSQLTPAGLDELALYATKRGAIAQTKIVRHFGPLHVHGWAPHPTAGSPEHMTIYDRKEGLSPVQWHTDQSPEPQPLRMTVIYMLESPAPAQRASRTLSPRFRKRLEGLTAIHSNKEGVTQEKANNGTNAAVRRQELIQEHPVVLVHPVTGEKALYVNPVYTKRNAGFDGEESDYLFSFLFDHIAKRQDFQCRVRYEAGTVLVWDQRVTNHSQTLDYPAGDRRHALRLTSLVNNPIPARVEEDDGECAKDY